MNDSSSAAAEIARRLTAEVAALAPGERVPSHRDLVRRYAASASTVAQALALLTQRGLIEARPGAGTFRARPLRIEPMGDTSWQEAALHLSESLGRAPDVARHFAASVDSPTP